MALSDKAKLYLQAGLGANDVGEEIANLIAELESRLEDAEDAIEALQNPENPE